MNSLPKAMLSVALLSAAVLTGYWLHQPAEGSAKTGSRKLLYYVDPMHPSYRSDKPGIAPDCGMQLEPVYDGDTTVSGESSPGAVRISVEKQQIMGLRTTAVTRSSGSHTLRALGRVGPDETLVYRVTALAEGVVRQVSNFTVGTSVKKDDLLATYFVNTRELYSAMQSYFVAVTALEQGSLKDSYAGIMDQATAQVRLAQELLEAYGVSEAQLRNIVMSRKTTRDIEFRAPADGLILSRAVGMGQKLDRGTEIFRIADIRRIWVLADLFESDSGLVKPGSAARIVYRGRTLPATVTAALPQFDPASRTLKLRLDVTNPEMLLRPDMFVDVEFDLKEPDGISVPLDAILDSGTRKTVFVEARDGVFEARAVVTGTRYGDRVQVHEGLQEGDRVVVSGMFLLDSESRLQRAVAVAAKAPMAAGSGELDPVCGMPVDATKSKYLSGHDRKTYHFCSQTCKDKFDAIPAQYTDLSAGVSK